MKKTVLVTGASSGIGLELAKIFAQNGYELVLVGRDKERLSLAIQQLKQFNVKVTPYIFDLAKPQAVEDLFKVVKEPIDMLVNNAGVGLAGAFVEQDITKITKLIQLNIVTLTQMCRLFGAQMVNRKQGKILNLASTAAYFPGPLMSAYYASKAYVLSFSESLAEELVGTGVTVTCLCPGPTKTNFQKRAQTERSKLFSLQMMKAADVARIGYEGLMAEKRVIVPGLVNQLQVFLSRFVPRSWEARVIRKLH